MFMFYGCAPFPKTTVADHLIGSSRPHSGLELPSDFAMHCNRTKLAFAKYNLFKMICIRNAFALDMNLNLRMTSDLH